MSEYDRRENTAEHSRDGVKRKRSSLSEHSADVNEHSEERYQVRRSVGTLALMPQRSLARRRRRRKRKEKITSSVEREWVFSSSSSQCLKDKMVVVSYNILGVDNALNHMDLYFNVPPMCLEWNRRKHLMCKEISRYNADILCLQEVDRFDDLDDILQKTGFQGVHKGRTGEASDGCAIFWKENMFKLLHHQDIEFERFGLRNNIAQLCVLEMNHEDSESKLYVQPSNSRISSTSARRVVVGNIHVLFNPKRGDIKLGQVRHLLEKANKLSQEWGDIPVIIAGDMNSTPKSAIYEFMASAKLDMQLHDRRQISGQFEFESRQRLFRWNNRYTASATMSISEVQSYEWTSEELRLATGSESCTHVQHQLKLQSAYTGVPGTRRTRDHLGEPLATSHHSRFLGTVDYIWHTDQLVPVRVLETLPVDMLKRIGGLPSEKWGSDHLAIACELAFAND